MLKKINTHTTLLLILLAVVSCIKKSDKENTLFSENTADEALLKALFYGHYTHVENDLGVCIYQDTIYVLSDRENGFREEKFMLHFLNDDNTFVNKDFSSEEYLAKNISLRQFKGLSLLKIPYVKENYKAVRIGQYIRLEDGTTQNIWMAQISTKNILNNTKIYNNEFEHITGDITTKRFEQELQKGRFFKNHQNIYVAYNTEEEVLYFIADKSKDMSDKFMLHFIKQDSTFINHSFFFENENFLNVKNHPYNNYKITRKKLPLPESLIKIRIGQFRPEGNIWAQELIVNEIKNNPLLRYDRKLLKAD